MKMSNQTVLLIVLSGLLAGCGMAAKHKSGARYGGSASALTRDPAETRPDRMLVWTASLNVEVWNVSNAVAEAVGVAERFGGFLEKKSDGGENSASLTLRIPAKTFRQAAASMESLGTVTYRSVEGQDVTEQYVDVAARLKNKMVLRDRLAQLLQKATDVKDILAIETEMNRVQADIDSMEGRIKSLRGQVDYATLHLSLRRKAIPGPLGYLFKGLWWGVEKLFVIRD